MWNSLNRKGIAAGLAAAGAAVLLMPVLLGFELPSIGAISSNVVGAIMILSAAGIAYGSLALWSALVLGGGAWTLVAPRRFRFLRRR
ncbi:MAG TPA: hypothetical protein VM346_07950 [Sphingomicrobium sp.]|nr:hypothetical protein [Sphingomicrobium sp.]